MADLHEPRSARSARRLGRHSDPAGPPEESGADPSAAQPRPAEKHRPVEMHRSAAEMSRWAGEFEPRPEQAGPERGRRAAAITTPNGMPIVDAIQGRQERSGEIYLPETNSAEPLHRPLNAYLPEFQQSGGEAPARQPSQGVDNFPATPAPAPARGEGQPQYQTRAERRRAEALLRQQQEPAQPVVESSPIVESAPRAAEPAFVAREVSYPKPESPPSAELAPVVRHSPGATWPPLDAPGLPVDARGTGRRPDAREPWAPSRESNRSDEGRTDARAGQGAGSRPEPVAERESNGAAEHSADEALPQRSRGEVWNRGGSQDGRRRPAPERPVGNEDPSAPSPRSSEAFWSQIESSRQTPRPDRAPRPDAARSDEPRYDASRSDELGYDEPRSDEPRYDASRSDEPSYDEPRSDAPRYDAPRSDELGYDEPRSDAFRSDGPRYDDPRYDDPRNNGPQPGESRYDIPQRDEAGLDQRSVPQSREQREQQGRARDASDAMWLKDLARPETPASLFKPQQTPRDPRPQQIPQGFYGPRETNPGQQQPDRAYQEQYQQPYQQQYQSPMPPPGDRPPNPEQAGRPAQKQRLAWIDTARGLAIILVVFIHATQWVQEAPIRIGVWDDINEVVSTLRMPLFFMCAGILATKWLYASWADLIAKKVFFLGWVFVLWQVVGSFEALVAAQITGDQLTPMRMVLSLALSPARPRFELWFIWALALFFVITRLTSRFPLAPQLVAGALMASIAFSTLIPEVNLGWNGFLKYYLFFVIGSYYRPLLLALAARMTKPLALAATGGWLLIAAVTYVTDLIYIPGVGLLVRLFGLVAGIGVALLLQNIKLFSYLGSRTLPIFLAHTPLLVLMVFVLDQVATTGAVQSIKWFLPVLLTVPAIYLALMLNQVALRTPARVLYEPPEQATDLVRNTIAQQPGGAEKMPPSLVPGLHERPFERQLERVLA